MFDAIILDEVVRRPKSGNMCTYNMLPLTIAERYLKISLMLNHGTNVLSLEFDQVFIFIFNDS